MLVGGGVEDDLRAVELHQLPHLLAVAHRGNLNFQVELAAVLHLQLLLQVVGVVFIDVDHHQLFGVALGNLAAQFRTDRAAAAGDHDHLAAQKIEHFLIVKDDALAAEQIVDLDVAHILAEVAALHRSEGIGQHLDVAVQGGAHLQNLLAADGVGRGDGEDDLGDHRVAQQKRHHVDFALDFDAVDKLADLFRVVVKKADRLIVVAGVVLHLIEQTDTRIARADDGTAHLSLLASGVCLHAVFAVDKARGHHQQKRHRVDAQRQHAGDFGDGQQLLQNEVDHIGQRPHQDHRDILIGLGVAPQAVVGFGCPQKAAQAQQHQPEVWHPVDYLLDGCAVADRHPVDHDKINDICKEQIHQEHQLFAVSAQAFFLLHNAVLHFALKFSRPSYSVIFPRCGGVFAANWGKDVNFPQFWDKTKRRFDPYFQKTKRAANRVSISNILNIVSFLLFWCKIFSVNNAFFLSFCLFLSFLSKNLIQSTDFFLPFTRILPFLFFRGRPPPEDFCGTAAPAPTFWALHPKPRVTFSPMRKSPKNLPEGFPLWVLP